MATNIQVLLPLLCMVFAEKQYTDRLHLDVTDHRESLMPNEPLFDDKTDTVIPLSPAVDRQSVDQIPLRDDVYSYNIKRTYDRFDSYREHTDLFSNRNLNDPPSGILNRPSAENKLNLAGDILTNQLTNFNGNYKNAFEKFNQKNNENKEPDILCSVNNQRLENKKDESESPAKLEKEKEPDANHKVNINTEKDYHLEDSNGNGVYISHENIPRIAVQSTNDRNTVVHIDIISNTNNLQQPPNQFYQVNNSPPPVNTVHISIVASIPSVDVPNINQLRTNTAVPVPSLPNSNNQHLPNNQNYQVLSGQPTPINVPIRPNRQNGVVNAIQSNHLWNSYSPTSMLIYANGELILIPGITITPQQFIVPVNTGDHEELNVPGNAVFVSEPNQSAKPMIFQTPNNVAPMSNGGSKTGFHTQDFQSVHNPGINGFYYMPEGYGYPIPYNQKPITNAQNQNSVGATNYPATQQPTGCRVNGNENIYQHQLRTPAKGTNLVAPPLSNILENGQMEVKNSLHSAPAVNYDGTSYSNSQYLSNILGAQPALMVPGPNKNDGYTDTKDKIEEGRKRSAKI